MTARRAEALRGSVSCPTEGCEERAVDVGFAMLFRTFGQDAVQTYFANSAVLSPQVTFSLMLVPPMVTSTNPITGSVKASMRGRCSCRPADGRPRQPHLLGELTIGAAHGPGVLRVAQLVTKVLKSTDFRLVELGSPWLMLVVRQENSRHHPGPGGRRPGPACD